MTKREKGDGIDEDSKTLGVRETAERLGVHENTIRNWARGGILESAKVPGSRVLRFASRDVERLATSRGKAVSSVEEERRTLGPELIDASALNQWATTKGAQHQFPELMRRLLAATPGVSEISIRAGEGTTAPGWDGRAHSAASAFLPSGDLLFEFGVGVRPKRKAEEDYEKRRTDPRGAAAAKSIFVFATPRRWTEAAAWAAERAAEGHFADVAVIDADDLEGWLQRTPAVHVWISELLGHRPRHAETLEHWWERFRARTEPELPPALFLAGRDHSRVRLLEFLGGPAGIVAVKAAWREDALAFCAATFEADEEAKVAAPPLIVSSSQVWEQVIEQPEPMILVPTFDGADSAAAVRRGHRVVIAIGWDQVVRGDHIELPRPGREDAIEALKTAGLDSDRAYVLAAQARRSMPALVRRLSRDPHFERPPWSLPPDAVILAPLVLVGSWTIGEPDIEIVTEVVGRPWEEIERTLQQWRDREDPPFVRPSGQWHLASAEEALLLLAPRLTEAELARWNEVCAAVLSEVDPRLDLTPEERPMASLRGAVRSHSPALRGGLAQSIALLGSVEGLSLGGNLSGADHARRLVRRLLGEANEDDAGVAWRALADQLQPIAEGSPEEFLDAVQTDLEREKPLLAKLFEDEQGSSALFGSSSSHTTLLWALELLCWSPEYLPAAAGALARLAEIDPGGQLTNRPLNSLAAVLVGWIRQTGASLQLKIDVVKQICKRVPEVGWKLLLQLWPNDHLLVSPPATPSFHDWRPEKREISIAEWATYVDHLVRLAADLADRDAERWAALSGRLGPLPPSTREELLDRLQRFVDSGELTAQGRLDLWEALDREIARNRAFADAGWAMGEEPLARMEAIAEELQPDTDPARFAFLFDWHPDLPGLEITDDGYAARLAELRRHALQQVLASGSAQDLARLAERSAAPGQLGWSLAPLAPDPCTHELLEWLDADSEKLREVAIEWAGGRLREGSVEWLREALAAPPMAVAERRLALALAAPATVAIWDALVEIDPELADRYWRRAQAWRVQEDDLARAVDELLDHDRPWAAIRALTFTLHTSDGEQSRQIDLGMIERVLDAALRGDANESPTQYPGYEVGKLLDYLENLGYPNEKLASYEFGFFRLLDHHRRPRALYPIMGESPDVFIDLVKHVYRGRNEPRRQLNESERNLAEHAWWVLEHWQQLPGVDENGKIDAGRLTSWVRKARLAFAESNRTDIGDEQIGRVLSAGPEGADGIWPAEPVRELLETIGSTSIETGVHTGVINSRGFTSRGVYDGGEQEREQATRYRQWARQSATRWPRTSRVLRTLAETFERTAAENDARAEITSDIE